MNIKSRIKKLEIGLPDGNHCQCPDAVAYAATPYFDTCLQCGKDIDLALWKDWELITPTIEDNYAFALRRKEEEI